MTKETAAWLTRIAQKAHEDQRFRFDPLPGKYQQTLIFIYRIIAIFVPVAYEKLLCIFTVYVRIHAVKFAVNRFKEAIPFDLKNLICKTHRPFRYEFIGTVSQYYLFLL